MIFYFFKSGHHSFNFGFDFFLKFFYELDFFFLFYPSIQNFKLSSHLFFISHLVFIILIVILFLIFFIIFVLKYHLLMSDLLRIRLYNFLIVASDLATWVTSLKS